MTKFTSSQPTIPLGRVPRGQYSLQGNGSMVKDTDTGVQENQITFLLGEIVRPRNEKGQTCHYIGHVDFFVTDD